MLGSQKLSTSLPVMIALLCIACSAVVGYQAFTAASDTLNALELNAEQYTQARAQLQETIVLSALAVLVVSQCIGQVYVSGVTRRLRSLTSAMRALQHGDQFVAVPYLGDADEFGEMALALQSFKESAQEIARLSSTEQETRAQREKRSHAMERMVGEFDQKMKDVLVHLASSSGALNALSQTMVDMTEESNSRSKAVVQASEETSNNVRAVAAAAEELSSSIHEITGQVARSAEISRHAVQNTQNADGTVQELAQTAQKIGDVVNLIDDIAEQINLLALNATIESARAGEAGKGFAVVASEVKTLASQTSKATQEIAAQIKAIQDVAKQVVQVLGGIRTTINELNDIAASIATSVEQQGAATQEIARNMSTAATIVLEVSNHSVALKDAAAETDGSARNVLSASQKLSEQSHSMRGEIEQFLTQIRAA